MTTEMLVCVYVDTITITKQSIDVSINGNTYQFKHTEVKYISTKHITFYCNVFLSFVKTLDKFYIDVENNFTTMHRVIGS